MAGGAGSVSEREFDLLQVIGGDRAFRARIALFILLDAGCRRIERWTS